MHKITILGNHKSDIYIGEQFSNINKYIPSCNVVIISDKNLEKHYKNQFPKFPSIIISTGENIKNLKTVEEIILQLINLGADRHTFILAIGGGIVCDIAGFVASIYMRGLNFGFVSTSLLSQVDASVGGKNGVNFSSYKNIIGNFNQPKFVICDMEMLKTLPQKEIQIGIAEIIKHALISDARMFDSISENTNKILDLNIDFLENLIHQNIKIKAHFIEKDETEQGERKKLNFGHTLAHAIEKHSNLSHGEAVALGIIFASRISFQKGYLSEQNLKEIIGLINNIGLDANINIDKEDLVEAICKDKKKNGTLISFILLDKIGQARIEEIEIEELKKWVYDLC